MIGYYLSSNNEMYYSAKTQTFSPTKHTLTRKEEQSSFLLAHLLGVGGGWRWNIYREIERSSKGESIPAGREFEAGGRGARKSSSRGQPLQRPLAHREEERDWLGDEVPQQGKF